MSATHETSLPLDKPEPRLADKLIFPEDARWEQARQAWNLAVDQQPAAVGLPESVEDVIAMIAFATERGLRVAPQSTGHAAGALDDLAGALLVKTSSIRGVRIDPDARTARAQAGALWTDVTAAAAPHGLAALAGSAADVGVVGYTLGGGVSWSGRRYGLACNGVTAVELVTAHTGPTYARTSGHEPDLFWGLRGGGGNFGVVTALEFALHIPDRLRGRSFVVVEALISTTGSSSRAPLFSVELRHLGGAMNRPPHGHGALAALDAAFALFAVGMAHNPDTANAINTHLASLLGALSPWDTGRRALSFAARPTDPHTAHSAETLERLRTVKNAYDPDNVIQAGAPIPTASQTAPRPRAPAPPCRASSTPAAGSQNTCQHSSSDKSRTSDLDERVRQRPHRPRRRRHRARDPAARRRSHGTCRSVITLTKVNDTTRRGDR